MIRADRVRALRQQRGYTQRELAKLINAAPSSISMIEAGKKQPSLARLDAMASALRTNAGYLLGENRSPRLSRCKQKVHS